MPVNSATKREPIDISIKNQIRSYYKRNKNLGVKDMVSWAEEKYGIPFLPSTMRSILFPKPTKKENMPSMPVSCLERHRERKGNWPELELELASWYRSLPNPPNGIELKRKAEDLWRSLAAEHYQGQELPRFGDSWRDKFKQRHGFKSKDLTVQYAPEYQACFSLDRAKVNDNNHTASASFSSVVDDMNFGTEQIYQLRSQFSDSECGNRRYIPAIPNEAQTVSWEETRSALAEQNYTSGILHNTRNNGNLPNSKIKPHNLQHELSGNLDDAYGLGLYTSNPTLSNQANRSRSCRTRNEQNRFKKRNTGGHVPQTLDPTYSKVPLTFYDSGNVGLTRESVVKLLNSSQADGKINSTQSIECIIKALISDLDAALSNHACLTFGLNFHQYDKSVDCEVGNNILQAMKALKLLQRAKYTGIKVPTQKKWPEWESLLMFDHFLLSAPSSPLMAHDRGLDDYKSTSAMGMRKDCTETLHERYQDSERNARKKCRGSILSMTSNLGWIDVRTSTIQDLSVPGISYFSAEVVLTVHGLAQLRFCLPPVPTQGNEFLILPTLSIRKTIPCGSKIFEIAASGTVTELVEMFSEGKASPEDCDAHGRSLINYALCSLNVETVSYLLGFVTDINTYEYDQFGYFLTLTSNLINNSIELEDQERRRQMLCLTKMLDSGADLSLEFNDGGTTRQTHFHIELCGGSKVAVEAILNSEQSSISPNSFGDGSDFELSPILYLAKCFQTGTSECYDLIEKFKLLIKRGADVAACDKNRRSCLHVVLAHDSLSLKSPWALLAYNHIEFKHILMALITAGAHLTALNISGITPSDYACFYGNEEIWIESLAACGRNPWDTLSLDNDLLKTYRGSSVFLGTDIIIRPTELSFQEFYDDEEVSEANRLVNIENSWKVAISTEEVALIGQIGIDSKDEYWFGSSFVCEQCLYHNESVEEEVRTSFKTHYEPINGDFSWLAYVYRPQYIFYLPQSDPEDEDSEDEYCLYCDEEGADDSDCEMDGKNNEGS